MQHYLDATRPPLALALQGGGSFGAFTWGVLDRLLEERGLPIAALSGASAGAVNAVLLADGLLAGGRAEAQARLGRFWRLLSDRAGLVGLPVFGSLFAAADLQMSPFQLALPGTDPLRDLLGDLVDFGRLRAERPLPLLVAATRVRDGEARIFREEEITLEVVLASACLPQLREAVRIDDEDYWDGGYSANPPLRDLVRAAPADDLMLVQLTPDAREATPRLRHDINQRSLEMAFAASLKRELEAIGDSGAPGRPRLHRLSPWRSLPDAWAINPANLAWPLLTRLAEAGRAAASGWLEPTAAAAE